MQQGGLQLIIVDQVVSWHDRGQSRVDPFYWHKRFGATVFFLLLRDFISKDNSKASSRSVESISSFCTLEVTDGILQHRSNDILKLSSNGAMLVS